MVKDFFEMGSFDPRLNETNICMIPKNEKPREMGEFRPISLCNVSYKIISKVLSNRLRKALPKLISETQLAFVARLSYKVIINGEAKGNIIPTRGLRQGDPLSPFLFILCTEALIVQLHGAEVEASGQQLNKQKLAILIGNKVNNALKANLKREIGIPKEGGMGTYLGLPETICGSKQQVFAFVQDRLNARINSWSAKFLSKGGREILIKSIAQALPTYLMFCFLLPKQIVNKLRGAIARFWWSTKNNKKGLHWVAWDKISVPLEQGGLGFRDLKELNLALLTKQLWRLLCYNESLLSRVLNGRYFRYSNPMDVKKANSPSFGWRSMMSAKPLLQQGLRKNIRSGFNTRVWLDNWIPTIPERPAKDRGTGRDPNLYVNHLIDFESKTWKMDKIIELVDPMDIPLITGLQPSRRFMDDYVWCYTKSGKYTVRSEYAIATKSSHEVLEPSTTKLKSHV
ncbi:PREDICTED: uncharacterized protein LOC109127334 [Camelina sativa]|uniref:Uncharacterized protein LOC109127334 n=1 Tax=Camelina sativa TaxID=90675 RepID=A0ABM1QL41_CAMSA|nr:PREDICTED: uncharacterized protein LOC109127334 [Camelina sativa]